MAQKLTVQRVESLYTYILNRASERLSSPISFSEDVRGVYYTYITTSVSTGVDMDVLINEGVRAILDLARGYTTSYQTLNEPALSTLKRGLSPEVLKSYTIMTNLLGEDIVQEWLKQELHHRIKSTGYRFTNSMARGRVIPDSVDLVELREFLDVTVNGEQGATMLYQLKVFREIVQLGELFRRHPVFSYLNPEGTLPSKVSSMVRWVVHTSISENYERITPQDIYNEYQRVYIRDLRVQLMRSNVHVEDYPKIKKRYSRLYKTYKGREDGYAKGYNIIVDPKPELIPELGVYLQKLTLKGHVYYINHYMYGVYKPDGTMFFRIISNSMSKREFIRHMVEYFTRKHHLVQSENQALHHLFKSYLYSTALGK